MKIREQSGVVLIELLAAIALSAIIVAGATMTIFQFTRLTERNQDRTTISRSVQNMGFRMNQDLLMAETVNETDDMTTPEVEFICMVWKNWETGDSYDIHYSWLDSGTVLKDVFRNQVVYDIDNIMISEINTMVARNISSVNITQENGLVRVNILAQSGDENSSRNYQIEKRME